MVSIPSNANPKLLQWARKTAGLRIEDVEKLEKLDTGIINAWESGEGTPTYAKLRDLAKRYKRPLHVFYLPEPPKSFNVVKDFRKLPAGVRSQFSPALTLAIRNAQERQAWAIERLSEEGEPKVSIVGSVKKVVGATEVAAKLRVSLGVTIEEQSEWSDPNQALNEWRKKCEQIGILSFQVSSVPIEEMRGFALVDKVAPVVAINSKDSPSARCFTLIHEVAHLLLGESAITGAGDYEISDDGEIERFCNRVAAETLVPEDHFRSAVPSDWRRRDLPVLATLSSMYKVSRAVIAFRLVEVGIADDKWLRSRMAVIKGKPVESGRSPAPPKRTLIRNGESFTRLAISAYHQGIIHGAALTKLLQLKLKYLPELEVSLFPSRHLPIASTDRR